MHRSSDEQECPVADDASYFTDEQVQLLTSHFTGQVDRAAGIVSMPTEYVGAGSCSARPVGR
ncbi:hypothetical protein ABZ799_26845 [Nocardiopsis dassonvillei]|uniref:hypothetical protein n=1 Tax=Nocardiopsis dassonvillei TaxID=2014 RepID=UPI0033C3CFF1